MAYASVLVYVSQLCGWTKDNVMLTFKPLTISSLSHLYPYLNRHPNPKASNTTSGSAPLRASKKSASTTNNPTTSSTTKGTNSS